MSPFEIPQTINLRAENTVKSYEQALVYGNKRAHRWRVTVLDGKAPANLAGCTATLYISRQDGKTVRVTDGITIREETVEAIFPAEAYAVEGSTVFELDIMMGEDVVSYATLCATVRRSRTDDMIIPGTGEIYDLAALLAQIDAMKTATTAANTAAANADAKAAAANTATGNANTATGNANAGADNANKAAAKINQMTIAASGLSAGASPTAALSEVDGHYHIALGIPKGDTGATPQISVQVATGAAGSEAQVGVSGTAENPVIQLTIPRGDVGDIGNLTINGKAPDGSGAVTLYALDVGALAASNGAGAHNAVYRGKELGTAVTDAQWAAIAAGTFENMYIGDYWTIDGITYRIAAFDYYYKTGDTSCGTHHVTLVPDARMYTHVMNDTNVTTGAYVGSKMYTNGLEQAKTTIKAAFGESHILTHRQYLNNAVTNGYASAGSWYDSTVELMTEQNVYGCKIFGNMLNGTSMPNSYTMDMSQYPLFKFRPDMISNRNWFWLRDVVSDTNFVLVNNTGIATNGNASNANGVRPAFSIC